MSSTHGTDIKQNSDSSQCITTDERTTPQNNSYFGVLMHLLKSIIGTGVLTLPHAFKESGFVFGIFGTVFVIFLCTYAAYILVYHSQEIRKKSKTKLLGFSDTCALICQHGPEAVQSFSMVFKYGVDAVICIGSLLTNCAFLIFIAQSFHQVFSYWFPHFILSVEQYIIIISVLLLIICQIRELKHLVPFSIFANICLFVGLLLPLVHMFSELHSPADFPAFTSVTKLPLFFGTVFFAADAMILYLPIENTMKNPAKFLGATGALNVSMVIVGILYTLFGLFGFLRYGEDTKPSITLNLPIEEIPSQIVQLMLPISIMLTYVLVTYVMIEIIWNNYLQYKVRGSIKRNLAQIVTRCSLVILTGAVSIAVPKLELVISLVGSVGSSTLILLVPVTLDTIVRWDNDLGYFKWRLFKNILIGIFYVFILVSSILICFQ
ncbi:hypothetical protein PPYR_06713 [Photinus pyralis]|nr:proton-coupled amino acid transporter-like protein pathetic isoform X2 [Photinus pyralis]XP_031339116.1 proton-coupled amino acid transporter-like protein pathetic isoform X2 [Photinus pyralis]XP_031339117.1 proton-coupled amino acid transporter-like protein pathetic isoform X2 [Photinus pyralis]XP_031339118.1 proton-coupled amino acid transporter-like protein pathetic isoform X2 [Photinus pyralis]XP_031339119.1 proton-coupled amino acid transporter-like protein pathetic isoform X2 [Photinus